MEAVTEMKPDLPKRFSAILVMEGTVGKDERLIEPTAFHWDEQRQYSIVAGDTHLVGIIDRIERFGLTIMAYGELYDTALLPKEIALVAVVKDVRKAGPGVDYPDAVVHCELMGVRLGWESAAIWPGCRLEFEEE